MDEAPEFSPRSLQTLREPLESGYVALSRAKGTTYYPARFQLIMAANPCPCGYGYGDASRCICKEKDRIKYFSRLSGPILDRIDIQIEVPPVNSISQQASSTSTSSHVIRTAVIQARAVARERFRQQHWVCNAQISGTWLRANTSRLATSLINQALERHRLSLRGADRAMRLAWTLADIEGKTSPGKEEIMQGIMLRTRVT
jgi:magnesium chelatase family protein